METTILTDIWTQINTSIDVVLMITIIAVGYIFGRTALASALFPKWHTTAKVLIVAVPVTILYTYFQKVAPGIAIASFFIAFGFHTVVLKYIDRFVLSMNDKK